LIEGWLVTEGYEVATAHSGEEALEQARAERPDLIILDRMMPFMEGCEVLKALREDLRLTGTPVIMLYSRPSDHDTYPWCDTVPREAASYLYKPFSREQLLSLIEAPRPGALPANDFRLSASESRPSAAPSSQRPWWRWWGR
jgi:DNA-binding response OmpR family regulator